MNRLTRCFQHSNSSWPTLALVAWLVIITAACNPTPSITPTTPTRPPTRPSIPVTETSVPLSPYPPPSLEEIEQPTSPPAGSEVPYPPPTATSEFPPIPTPRFADPRIITQTVLLCTPGGEYAACEDNLLGIKFEIPASWGPITATLRMGLTGMLYRYDFGPPDGRSIAYMTAGGVTRDFSEGRDGYITDFVGFAPAHRQDPCAALEYLTHCQVIQEGVVLAWNFRDAERVCEPGLGLPDSPFGAVYVDLPQGDPVQGLVFVGEFLSEDLHTQLDDLSRALAASIQYQEGKAACDPQLSAEYDSLVQDWMRKVLTQSFDPESNANIAILNHLAESLTRP